MTALNREAAGLGDESSDEPDDDKQPVEPKDPPKEPVPDDNG